MPSADRAFAGSAVLDQAQSREPSGNAQDEVRRHAFGGCERQGALGIRIVPYRGRESDIDAGAREIDGGVERIAAAGQRKRAVGPARQLDQNFADAYGAGFLLGHRLDSQLWRFCSAAAATVAGTRRASQLPRVMK